MASRIAITGASGFLGSHLTERLSRRGDEVQRVVRHPPRLPGDVWWDAKSKIDAGALEGVDALVHLAGEPISRRWTRERRERILRSRVDGTTLLARTLARLERPPRVFVCASAIGYYGDRGEERVDEDAEPGSGFLAEVTRRWEEATRPASDAGIRVVNVRTGIVVGAGGGAVGKMLLPFRMGVGGRVGNGRAWWSWIDLEDEVGALVHAIDSPALSGPVNFVAPHPVRSEEFTRALARVLGRPHLFPLPEAALKLAFGDMADEVLLASQRVSSSRLEASGYRFRHPTLEGSLKAQLHSG